MATKFQEIYGKSILIFQDGGLSKLLTDFKEAILGEYLLTSISEMQYSCPMVKDYDLELEQFNGELDNEIKGLLALGIAKNWLYPKVLNADLLRPPIMYNKDYQTYSVANQLKEIREVYESIESKFRGKINTYSFRNSQLENLKAGS